MLPPVTGLRQVSQDSTGTSFAWDEDFGADTYTITVDGAPDGSVDVTSVEVSEPAGAHVLGVTPLADPTPPTTLAFTVPVQQGAPDPPTGLVVTNITQTTATVSCDVDAGATAYLLYLDSALLSAQPSPVWNLTGLAPDSPHTIAVAASNSVGPSALSATVDFTTAEPVSPPPSSGSDALPLALVGAGGLVALLLLFGRGKKSPTRR